MDKLPPELLHRIFIQLDFEQRLACTLVCRSWWSVLDKYSLFYNLVLKKDKDHFSRFINMFKQSPDRAAQVEELDIELKDSYKFNRRKLLNIFPNTRVLNVEKYFDSDGFMFRHYKRHINNSHSKAKLEHLSDFYQCELVCQIISSKLGVRLKTLCLNTGSIPNTPRFSVKRLDSINKTLFGGIKRHSS
jgi:hypothetical protein